MLRALVSCCVSASVCACAADGDVDRDGSADIDGLCDDVRDLFVTAPGVEFHVRRGGREPIGTLSVDGLHFIGDDDDGRHVDLEIGARVVVGTPAPVPEDVDFIFDSEGDGGGVAVSGAFDFNALDADDVFASYGVLIDNDGVDGTVSYTVVANDVAECAD